MAISNIGTQDGTQNGTQDDVQITDPQTVNPPVDDTKQQDDQKIQDVQENQEIDLNLDLSDVKEVVEEKPEEKAEEISLDLENVEVKTEENNQQVNFQDIEETNPKKEENIEPVEEVKEEEAEAEAEIQEDIKDKNTEEKIEEKSEDLSMKLPPEIPSKEEDKEWLQEEDKETVKEEKNIEEKTEEKTEETTDLGGLDLSAISQAKFEGAGDLPLTGEKLADDAKETVVETTPPVMQSGGMLNLDDLGAMNTTTPVQAAPEVAPIVETPAPVIQEAAPVVAAPEAPVTPEIPVAVETPAPVVTEPVITAPEPQQAVMNQELNAAYDAVATPPAKVKGLHNNVSGSRKILSIVVLVVLMLGGGFYIFKTMFPDKVQNIISQNPAVTETPELIKLNETPETPKTPEIPEAPIAAVVTGTTDVPEAIVISTDTNTVVSVAGLDHAAADTGDTNEDVTSTGDEFDPFAEIEDILDKPSPYQAKIDILEMLLKSGEEYFELGDMAEDATILKYSRVLVQKIPTDIEILEVGADIDMAKIDQHIKLFETYLEKLEALASIE